MEQNKSVIEEIQGAFDVSKAKNDAGEYKSKNELIDAIIERLEMLKDKPEMGGLGEHEGMKLPEESAGMGGEEE